MPLSCGWYAAGTVCLPGAGLLTDDGHGTENSSAPSQLIATVTVAPLGLNVVVPGDPERAGHLAAAQALPQLELEDFPFGRPHSAERVADQGAQVRPFHVRGDVGRFVGHQVSRVEPG
jgi:hypothetical protein